MAWSLIANHTSKDTNTVSSDTLAFTTNNDPSSEGNHIIIVSGRFGNNGGTFTCADSAGNTYTPATATSANHYEVDSGSAQTDAAWLFWAPVTHSNVANTVTITAATGGSHRFTWAIGEWAPGVGTTVSLDAGPVATQFATGSTTLNVGPITTTGASDLVFSVSEADIPPASGFTVGGAWTAFENSYASTTRAVGSFQINVGAAAYTSAITPSAATSGAGIIIAFKAVASSTLQPDEDFFDTTPQGILSASVISAQSTAVVNALFSVGLNGPDDTPQFPVFGGQGQPDDDYWTLFIIQPATSVVNLFS